MKSKRVYSNVTSKKIALLERWIEYNMRWYYSVLLLQSALAWVCPAYTTHLDAGWHTVKVEVIGEEGRPVSTLSCSGGALGLTPRPWLRRCSRWQYYAVPCDAHLRLFLSGRVHWQEAIPGPNPQTPNAFQMRPCWCVQLYCNLICAAKSHPLTYTTTTPTRVQDTLPQWEWGQIKVKLNTARWGLACEFVSCDRNQTLGLPVASSAPIITAHDDATLTSAQSN